MDPLAPDDSADALLGFAAERALAYLHGVPTRRVAPAPEALAALSAFDHPLPAGPQPAAETLALLDRVGSPAALGTGNGRYFGFVTGGPQPATVASNWLTTAWGQNASLYAPAPMVATLERIALRWLLDLLGLPASAAGAFVTGSTVANLCALAAARHAVLRRVGWDVEADGLIGAPPITVVVGDEAHPTVLKSLGVIGLGRRRVVRVPVDGQGRLRAAALPRIDGPTIVVTQAGNVNTGAVDPVGDVVNATQGTGAWVHVDGAFGLWALASDTCRPLLAGVERADSWATDAHKWLNAPYDSGLAFVRDGDALRAAMSVSADYLPAASGDQRNPSDTTPELSRRARGVDVWVALRTLGRAGVADLVDRNCAHARRFARELAAAGAEVLNEVVLNQVLVAFGPPERTLAVIGRLQRDGVCWCGSTVWQGRTAMRISVCNAATTDDDVTLSLAAMRQAMAAA